MTARTQTPKEREKKWKKGVLGETRERKREEEFLFGGKIIDAKLGTTVMLHKYINYREDIKKCWKRRCGKAVPL